MALTYLNKAQNDATKSLGATCFTKQNYSADYENDTLSATTPNGVLGGSIAAMNDDYEVVPANGTNVPVGFFINDAAGRAWDNNQAISSNKLTIAKGMPSVEVDVYETHDAYEVELEYTVGDKLYASANGFVTNVESAEGTVVGILTKVPSTESPTMGIDARI